MRRGNNYSGPQWAFSQRQRPASRATIPNDTYGEITPAKLAELRALAQSCLSCGMLATVDPVFHASRYGHAPVIAGPGGTRLQWDGASWEPAP